MCFYGNIKAIHIELIYDNNKYLSDLVENKKATEEEKRIYSEIKSIEENIVRQQILSSFEKKDQEIKGIEFQRLEKVLMLISSGKS